MNMEATNEIYSTPETELTTEECALEAPLASRWARLGAAILDGIFIMVLVLPVLFMAGLFNENLVNGQTSQWVLNLSGMLAGIVAWMLLNGYLLHRSGQTLGKKLLGIRIVDLAGEKPCLSTLAGLRFLLMQVLYMIPVAGSLVALVDALMIFGKEKRCLHDRIASTRVVKV